MADLKLFCNNPNLNTLSKFIEYYKLRVVDKKDKDGKGYTTDEFFEYNRDTIFNQLDTDSLQELAKQKSKNVKDLTSQDIDKDVTLPCPSHLFINEKYVNYSLIAKHTNFQVQETDSIAFEDEQIREIIDGSAVDFKTSAVRRMNPGCRVIGYFKSLYFSGKKNNGGGSGIDNIYDSQQNFVDLSPYIITLNTSNSNGGGNFNLTLPHVPVYSDVFNNEMAIRDVLRNGINDGDYINKQQINKFYIGSGDQLSIKAEINALDYFEWLIQPNDLLFISFDDIEGLTDDNIAGNTFDMIALVDSVSVSRSASGSVAVSVSGRDFMKLLIEDSSIYFPSGVTNGNKDVFDNTETVIRGGDADSIIYKASEKQSDGTPRQISGLLDIFASEPNDFSIDFVLKTVISHLANIQIVPNDLFIGWGERRTTFSALKPKKNGGNG